MDLSVDIKGERRRKPMFCSFFGVIVGHSDKEAERKVVYWEIGDKGQGQGDGCSTRT